jgi:hypothetical protein
LTAGAWYTREHTERAMARASSDRPRVAPRGVSPRSAQHPARLA